MNDYDVLHHRRARRFDAVLYGSIHACSSDRNATFDAPLALPPTRRTCCQHRRGQHLTPSPTHALASCRTPAAAKIPIPS
jgi:hypothetical protein